MRCKEHDQRPLTAAAAWTPMTRGGLGKTEDTQGAKRPVATG